MADDLVLRGGTVVDGSGGPARALDVRIAGGMVTELGPRLSGDRVLDASGAVVAPGFIDIHTHYDAQVFWDPWLTPSSLQGVTSVIAGHCGLSLAPCRREQRETMVGTLHFVEDMEPEALLEGVEWSWEDFPAYRRSVAERGVGINFGGYVGHTAVRLWTLGAAAYEREATPEEIRAMSSVVADAVAAGAIGFSTDRSTFHRAQEGRMIPSFYGSQAEVEALMRAAAGQGGVCAVILDEDPSWIYRLQPSLGRPVTWCQIISYPDGSPRQPWAEAQLAIHADGLAGGADVHPQTTCRPITFQVSMAQPMPLYPVPAFGELSGLDVAGRGRQYRDPAWRARASEQLAAKQGVDPRWDKFFVEESPSQPELIGSSIDQLARKRGVDPLVAALDVALADDLATRFRVVFANDDMGLLERVLRTDGCVLGLSDAGAHNAGMCDAGLPVDFLARWVRDRSLMPLEQGVRKVTGELADFLGLGDRGYIDVGRPADIVVFDLDRLDPGPLRRVQDFPAGANRLTADRPQGLRHVLVNGVPIRADGEDVRAAAGRLPGRLLSSAASGPPLA
jgi:N-acyl-D-aspartate/D-glutamate deacylase